MRHFSFRLALWLALVLLTTSCGDGVVESTVEATAQAPTTTTGASTTTATTTTDPEPTVEVMSNLAYRSGDSGPSDLDVYYRTATEGGPVVVLFHGGAVDKSYQLYPPLAQALAEQGAVVFVPNWNDELTDQPDVLASNMDGAGCAVSYALGHAADYGADPDTLVLVGNSAGVWPAAMSGLREPNPVPDCSVAMAPLVAAGMVLWDGDFMLGAPVWDQYGDKLPDLMEPLTPWTWLADGPKMQVVFVTAAGARALLKTCGVSDPTAAFWVRDPDGWFHQQLGTMGALDDDCFDIGETADLLAAVMTQHGFDATHLILEDSGHTNLAGEDLAQLVKAVIVIADS